MKSVDLQYDFTGLNDFIKSVDHAGRYVVKVGIFGNKTTRGIVPKNDEPLTNASFGGNTLTNAELGLIHEKGSYARGIPARSFLKMPLSLKSKEIISNASIGAAELMAKGQVKKVLDNLGVACKKWIDLAFATGGFGSWKHDAPSTIRRKGSNAPLIDTAQLRRSIAYQVQNK